MFQEVVFGRVNGIGPVPTFRPSDDGIPKDNFIRDLRTGKH